MLCGLKNWSKTGITSSLCILKFILPNDTRDIHVPHASNSLISWLLGGKRSRFSNVMAILIRGIFPKASGKRQQNCTKAINCRMRYRKARKAHFVPPQKPFDDTFFMMKYIFKRKFALCFTGGNAHKKCVYTNGARKKQSSNNKKKLTS